ncbi:MULTISPECIES: molecular chaperone [unclassified Thiocapsa]|uniref:molecular chaperone n=1 Tax=unclassified Thiocapsa TaxID=2641286 RepID=UPI0035B027FC
MNAVLRAVPPDEGTLKRFCTAAAEDLALLALLHDRELTPELLLSLWEHCYEDFLGIALRTQRGRQAEELLREGLTEIPASHSQEAMDHLAADYADIYLNHGIGASPCESVWLDDDHLTMQEPMFRVRAWYRSHGLAVEDWRRRTDDHLVHQLRFLAHLLTEEGPGEAALSDAARFLDEHLLHWIDAFAARVAARCATRFYAGLAMLTAAWIDELRDLLAEILEQPRPTAEEMAERLNAAPSAPVEVAGPYVPGAAPGW